MPIFFDRATVHSEAAARTHDVVAPGFWPHLPNIGLGLLRVVSGLMLMQHGAQKHFGALLAPGQSFMGSPPAFSQTWIAGTLELGGGLLLALGLFTRPVAFILSGFMASAYFLVHAPRGFFPILNNGELAALYCFVFLALAATGGGRFSLDQLIGRRRGLATRRVRDETEDMEIPLRVHQGDADPADRGEPSAGRHRSG